MFSDFQQCLPTSSNSAILVTSLHQLRFLMVSYSLQIHCTLIAMSTAVFSEFLSVFSELLIWVEIRPVFFSLKIEYMTYKFSHRKSWIVAKSWFFHFWIPESRINTANTFHRGTFNRALKSRDYEKLSSHFKTEFQVVMVVEKKWKHWILMS